ncbi:MAG: HD domain-containing protein [Anaerolineales bacterium]|jgi:uncharacterized protein
MPTVEMARQWYPGYDPVHGFDHVLRVYRLAEQLAEAEGADLEIVRAAALLHDAVGALPTDEGRAAHHQASADLARQVLAEEGWPAARIAAVEHCIRAHRYRSTETPRSLEAQVLFDADKLDVLGAFGVARTIAYAVQAGQPIYARPSETFLASGQKESQEAHSSYHEYLYKLQHVNQRLFTNTARDMARERHELLVQFYTQLDAEARGV